MASLISKLLFQALLLVSIFCLSNAAGRRLTGLGENQQQKTMLFQYHNGPLLSGKISVNLIWYGNFKPAQRTIISDLVSSLSGSSASLKSQSQPSVSNWWRTTDKYYHLSSKNKKPSTSALSLQIGKQILDEKYSLGKSLTRKQIVQLAARGNHMNAINVVLTAADVKVEGFCMNTCGSHGSIGRKSKFAYIWVGNSETQCPGQCAWPFHQSTYGPQNPPLIAPNKDVGMDGMVINLASFLAATATNPFGNGFYQGPATAPLEAASACPGIYGKGAFPGYAGKLLVDSTTHASYNAIGANGRKYLLPALFDPFTSSCSTLV